MLVDSYDILKDIIRTKNSKLYLIGGASGSGKSTFAAWLESEIYCSFPPHIKSVILEADMYFYDEKGVYNFDPSKLRFAHEWCQKTAKVLLDQGFNVIVANTFVKEWESKPYRDMANGNFVMFRMLSQFKNVHGVPEEKVAQMRENTQPVEGEYSVKPWYSSKWDH